MQQRQLLWLLGALVVLVGLAFLTGSFDKGTSTVDLPDLRIPGDDLTRIVVTRDGQPFAFDKQEGTWRVTEPVTGKADSALVAQFIGNLAGVELETVVSNSEARYAEYGFGEMEKQIDLIWDGGGKTLLVGNPGPDAQSYYLRIAGDRRVYLTRGRLNLPDDTDRWRDKTVLKINPLNLEKAVITGPDAGYEVAYTPAGWTLTIEGEDPEPADSAAVATWLGRFAPLNAMGFVRGVTAADIKANATHQIHFSIPNAGTRTVWIQDRESELAVTATGTDEVLRLAFTQRDLLAPEAGSLAEE